MIPVEQLCCIGAHLAETPVLVDDAEHHSSWIEGQPRLGQRRTVGLGGNEDRSGPGLEAPSGRIAARISTVSP